MLHLSNQRLYARENHIPKPSPRSRAYRYPISYLGFGFSIFSPRSLVSPPRVPYPSSPRDLSRSSAHLRSQALVRPQRNGRSVAFWTKACSQEGRKEKFASRLGSVSLSPSPFHSSFFRLSDSSFRTRFHFTVHAITFACTSVERAPAQFQGSFIPFRTGKLIHDRSRFFVTNLSKNRADINVQWQREPFQR